MFEHQSPVNKNCKPLDSINRGTVLLGLTLGGELL